MPPCLGPTENESACAATLAIKSAVRHRHGRGSVSLAVMTIAWLAAVCTGMGVMINYETRPGRSQAAPANWPSSSRILRTEAGAHLIMFVHPHCPCSRASIGELARIMARCRGRVSATVAFLKPSLFQEDWTRTDLWRSAEAIPGVQVMADHDGTEARRFGAVTSGLTALYDADGRVLFNGGITQSRGHSGDNNGASAIVSILKGAAPDDGGDGRHPRTCVFGCPLFAPGAGAGGD